MVFFPDIAIGRDCPRLGCRCKRWPRCTIQYQLPFNGIFTMWSVITTMPSHSPLYPGIDGDSRIYLSFFFFEFHVGTAVASKFSVGADVLLTFEFGYSKLWSQTMFAFYCFCFTMTFNVPIGIIRSKYQSVSLGFRVRCFSFPACSDLIVLHGPGENHRVFFCLFRDNIAIVKSNRCRFVMPSGYYFRSDSQ